MNTHHTPSLSHTHTLTHSHTHTLTHSHSLTHSYIETLFVLAWGWFHHDLRVRDRLQRVHEPGRHCAPESSRSHAPQTGRAVH
jgi:hypothetical protein